MPANAFDHLPAYLPDVAQHHITVVGDVMLDGQWRGVSHRISPEAPVPVVQVQDQHEVPGGAANVAMNLRKLGCQVTLFGMVGDDAHAERLTQLCDAAGITCVWLQLPDHPTTTKYRISAQHQQLVRMDFEQVRHAHLAPGYQPWFERFRDQLRTTRVVVLSDYAKGVLTDPQPWIQAAKAAQCPVLIDPKQANVECYLGADLLTPNWREWNLLADNPMDPDDGFEERTHRMIERGQLGGMLVTRGADGMSLFPRGGTPPLHLPAHVADVYDVTGAGDTVLAVMAAGLVANLAWPEAAALANLAASYVVTHAGCVAITRHQLQHLLQRSHGSLSQPSHAVICDSWEQLEPQLAAAREVGDRIVMTNGCFDIFHPGHLDSLQRARAMGDRLLVAVNTDRSVQALKGPSRPVHACQHRMEVLSGIRHVDWVVPFDERTPLTLIEQVRPDVLVKGGDYRPEAIVGYDVVTSYGGDVVTFPLYGGYATSNTVAKLQGSSKTS